MTIVIFRGKNVPKKRYRAFVKSLPTGQVILWDEMPFKEEGEENPLFIFAHSIGLINALKDCWKLFLRFPRTFSRIKHLIGLDGSNICKYFDEIPPEHFIRRLPITLFHRGLRVDRQNCNLYYEDTHYPHDNKDLKRKMIEIFSGG